MHFSHPYLADTRFVCFAHRGGGDEQPENTRRAFDTAVTLGYRFIETDVQATADGKVMVYHDDRLDRLTDMKGVISELPFAALCQARIGGSEPIMTLEEVLNIYPHIRFNIDIKTDHALQPTLDLVQRMNCLDRICLASFSDKRLRHIRKALGPAACTGAGPGDVAALKFASWGAPRRRISALCAQVPLREYGVTIVTRRFVRYCNNRGIAVHVWTIDDDEEMHRLIRLGVNGIMTNRPSLLKAVAIEEGVWCKA